MAIEGLEIGWLSGTTSATGSWPRDVAARFSSLTAELGQAKATASQDLEFLTRIADIYIELGGIKKGLLSLRRAKNQTADPGGKAALVERLAKLSREPEA